MAAVRLAFSDPRAFRLTTLFAAILVCGLFDLAFTCTQLPRGNFAEANVVAASFIDAPGPLITYKGVLFGVGAALLFRCRRRWESEAGLWLVLGCHLALMACWIVYIDTLEQCLSDPVVSGPAMQF
jgi:hypothetical protein